MTHRRTHQMNKSKNTYKQYTADGRLLLQNLLIERKFSNSTIKKVLDSGYFAMKADTFAAPNSIHVIDGLYGSKTFYGFIPLEMFFDYLKAPPSKYSIPAVLDKKYEYKVHSIREAKKILLNSSQAPYFYAGEMSFRGQNNRYFLRRSIPNPSARKTNGDEELILANYWRQFSHYFTSRPITIADEAINAFFFDPILKDKIPEDVITATKNEFYNLGYRLPSEYDVVSHVDDPTIGEITRKLMHLPSWYVRYSDKGRLLRQLPTIQQHYGIKTAGLDITFDLSVACFFALNSFFTNENGKGYFSRTYKEINPVVYCFVFEVSLTGRILTRHSRLILTRHSRLILTRHSRPILTRS